MSAHSARWLLFLRQFCLSSVEKLVEECIWLAKGLYQWSFGPKELDNMNILSSRLKKNIPLFFQQCRLFVKQALMRAILTDALSARRNLVSWINPLRDAVGDRKSSQIAHFNHFWRDQTVETTPIWNHSNRTSRWNWLKWATLSIYLM